MVRPRYLWSCDRSYGGHCLGSGDGHLSIEVVDSDDIVWCRDVMAWPCSPRRLHANIDTEGGDFLPFHTTVLGIGQYGAGLSSY